MQGEVEILDAEIGSDAVRIEIDKSGQSEVMVNNIQANNAIFDHVYVLQVVSFKLFVLSLHIKYYKLFILYQLTISERTKRGMESGSLKKVWNLKMALKAVKRSGIF